MEIDREATSGILPISCLRVDPNLSEPLPLRDRKRDDGRCDHALEERPVDADDPRHRPRRDERERVLSERRLRRRVHARRRDHVNRAVARQPPGEEGGEIGVPPVARRAAEKRGVDGDSVRPRGGHLGPARLGRVARLDAEQAGIAGEQVVPGRQPPAAGDRRRPVVDHGADHRVLHRDPREPGDVARARVVARLVEPVRVREVRVAQAEPLRPRRSSSRRSRPGSRRRARRARPRRRSRSGRAPPRRAPARSAGRPSSGRSTTRRPRQRSG